MHDHRHEHHHDKPLSGDLERGTGAGKTLFLDAFSGIAGDMLVAALLDLGVPWQVMEEALDCLPLEGYEIEIPSIVRSGIVARRFHVHVDQPQPERTYEQIRSMLVDAPLPEGAKRIALEAFELLGKAEAEVHGSTLDDVHFHEVGAVDSIVDIVATAVGLDYLGARVVASPLPMGKGLVTARHGVLPLPAPATVSCLQGVPTYDAGIDGELVTPTGACLVASSAEDFCRWPAIRPERVGWGSGTRDLPDRPNLLRVVLASSSERSESAAVADAPFVVLEANVDDMTAEMAAHAVERCQEAGALDVWTTPIGMKKGRAAIMISALTRSEFSAAVAEVFLRETTSLGVRLRPANRIERPRHMITVDTPYGQIPVKVATGDGLPINLAPEFDACREAALEHQVPIKEVFAAALSAARQTSDPRKS